MGDLNESMSREKGFLEAFFLAMSQFSHDKAKLLAEKEKEPIKTQPLSIWNAMLSVLAQLAVAEKSYMTLNFMTSRGFLRKDNTCRLAYEALRQEIRKMRVIGGDACHVEGTLAMIIYDICHLLEGFMYMRDTLMDVYDRMIVLGPTRFLDGPELNEKISNVSQMCKNSIHQPSIILYKNNISFECDALTQLLMTQHELQRWSFMPALFHLYTAHCKLVEWAAASKFNESRRLSFGPGFLKPLQLPYLYQWLMKFKAFVVSKFTLYFREILSKQTNHQEMKNLCSKAPVDLYHKMSAFQRKSDAIFVALVYLVSDDGDEYTGHGYHHPDKPVDKPRGLNSYPAVVCCPAERPMMHWPNIVTIIEDRAYDLTILERVVGFHDKQFDCTYIVVRVETKMNFVAILNGKRSEKESYVAAFIEDFCTQLRPYRILQALKPGNK